MPKLGRQPALEMLKDQDRWNTASLARQIGVTRNHVINALWGRSHPSNVLREQLPALLGRPLTELFTPASLAKPHTVRKVVAK